MARIVIDVADIKVAGEVISVGRGNRDDGTYVRFNGLGGTFSVFVADGIPMDNGVLRVGCRVVVACRMQVRGQYESLQGLELREESVQEASDREAVEAA